MSSSVYKRGQKTFTIFCAKQQKGDYNEQKKERAWIYLGGITCGQEHVILPWLEKLNEHIKTIDTKAKTTVGIPPSLQSLRHVEPFTDFLSPHLYVQSPENMNAFVSYANEKGKAMVSTEIGWGTIKEADRLNNLRPELTGCVDRKVGFMIHALHHSLVADLHRPEYGPVNVVGNMSCINPDGSLREGHEMINDYL